MKKQIFNKRPYIKVSRKEMRPGTIVEISPFSLGRIYLNSFARFKGKKGIVIDMPKKKPLFIDVLMFTGEHIRIRQEFVKVRYNLLPTRKGR